MVVTSKVQKPDSVIVTLTITQTLSEWKRLAEQMEAHKWPACDLVREINGVVRKTERDIFLTEEEREGQREGPI